MGSFNGVIFSKTLKMDVGLSVILPQDSRKHRGVEPLAENIVVSDKPKTLMLLHGLGDNHCAWLNKTAIYRYAEEYDVAVIMPEVHRSFYQNMRSGHAFESYIIEELPELASKLFNISTEPDDFMLAGLSMGGYGSLYYGLKYPERFSAIGAFSSAVDVITLMKTNFSGINRDDLVAQNDMLYAFGDVNENSVHEYDIYYQLEQAIKKDKTPPIFMTIGRDDVLCKMNQLFAEQLDKVHYNHEFQLLPGAHDWDVWDPSVHMFLERFAKK